MASWEEVGGGGRRAISPPVEGAKFPGDDEPEDEAAPNENKKRTTRPEKRVFVTEPLPKKAKPVSASDEREIHGGTSTPTAITPSRIVTR